VPFQSTGIFGATEGIFGTRPIHWVDSPVVPFQSIGIFGAIRRGGSCTFKASTFKTSS
jgi:hypothetical protein